MKVKITTRSHFLVKNKKKSNYSIMSIEFDSNLLFQLEMGKLYAEIFIKESDRFRSNVNI